MLNFFTSLTFDEAISIFNILISVVGLLFVIVGWIVPYRQSIKLDKQNRKASLQQTQREMKIQRIDEQLSKYYGPILAILKEQDIIWQGLCEEVGRTYIFKSIDAPLNSLEPDNQKRWVHFVDTYKIPMQRQIADIMKENAHLAEVDITQTAPYEFLSYVVGWEMLDRQKKDGVPNFYDYNYPRDYPANFNKYIKETFDKLLQERNRLLDEMC